MLDLEDIILPPALGWWPLAWGWWLLIIATLLGLAALIYFFKRQQMQRKQHRHALQQLEQHCTQLTGPALYSALNTWLKLQLQPEHPQALNLYGQAWADFLNASTSAPVFTPEMMQALTQGVYQPASHENDNSISPEQCFAQARQWLGARHV